MSTCCSRQCVLQCGSTPISHSQLFKLFSTIFLSTRQSQFLKPVTYAIRQLQCMYRANQTPARVHNMAFEWKRKKNEARSTRPLWAPERQTVINWSVPVYHWLGGGGPGPTAEWHSQSKTHSQTQTWHIFFRVPFRTPGDIHDTRFWSMQCRCGDRWFALCITFWYFLPFVSGTFVRVADQHVF